VIKTEKLLPSADYKNENKCSILKGTIKLQAKNPIFIIPIEVRAKAMLRETVLEDFKRI